MKKLGFEPEPHKLHRNPKHFIHTWTNGETRIGLFCVNSGGMSKKKHDSLPIVNRMAFTSQSAFKMGGQWKYGHADPGMAKINAEELVKSAVKTLE